MFYKLFHDNEVSNSPNYERIAHFSLDSDVQQKFVQLLAIDQDAERKHRVEGDDFCSMLDQIKNGQRKLSLTERKKLC